MWHCTLFSTGGRVLTTVDHELELFRAGREFQEVLVEDRYLVDVQDSVCVDARTGRVAPCWRSPPVDLFRGVVEPLLRADTWEVRARPGVYSWHTLYAAFRPESFVVQGRTVYAGDVNAALDVLLRELGRTLARARWRAPPIFHRARCVECGRRLGVHIPITDALADADPELVSAKNTEPAVFRFDPRSVLIARKQDRELLCVRGTVGAHQVCMMLGEFRHGQ